MIINISLYVQYPVSPGIIIAGIKILAYLFVSMCGAFVEKKNGYVHSRTCGYIIYIDLYTLMHNLGGGQSTLFNNSIVVSQPIAAHLPLPILFAPCLICL